LKVDYCKTNEVDYQESKFFIVGATPTNKFTGSHDDLKIKLATKNSVSSVIKFAQKVDWIPNVINLSSGAVYGEQVNTLQPEKDIELKALNLNQYSLSKIDAEFELQKSNTRGELSYSSPRLFAFLGPHLPLEAHFAIGNFLNDCLNGNNISVNGNPQTTRSYLYPTDLVMWLIKLLVKPTNLPLNFGSDKSMTMKEIANNLSVTFDGREIEYKYPDSPISHYVPSIENTKKYLGVSQSVSFSEGMERWIKWLNN
jgi:dTDP-glucose 4,6-dehydratase